MQTKQASIFTSVHIEGALLPADLLVRIAEGKDVPVLTPNDENVNAIQLRKQPVSLPFEFQLSYG
jgi:hypothetical protein